ncbi:MAG TPA: hypothetical protein VF522_06420 [Ramlibacter sp.]|uniref:hypothetical protein n=1 Tax=Ramlibacter sp. TaxID=1917967 RepID=UPI002ED48E35
MAKIVPDAPRHPLRVANPPIVRFCSMVRELKTLALKGKLGAVKLRPGRLAVPRFSSLSGRLDV